MQTIDGFIDQGRQNMKADSDRLTAAAFQNIYDQGIATLADGEPLDPADQQRFQQACGFWGKSPKDIDADVTAAKAKKQAQATVDRAGSIHAKSAYIDAMFRAAGISPLRDTPGYRDSLSAMRQEVEGELQMLQAAESLLAQHEPMSTTADGLPGAVAIHEASHAIIGTALGGRLESLSMSDAGGITVFASEPHGIIFRAAVILGGSIGVGKMFNRPVFAHLSRQDSLNALRLLADDPHCVRSMRRAEYLASNIIAAHEGTIIAIARRLESERRLSADDLTEELAGIESWRHVAA